MLKQINYMNIRRDILVDSVAKTLLAKVGNISTIMRKEVA